MYTTLLLLCILFFEKRRDYVYNIINIIHIVFLKKRDFVYNIITLSRRLPSHLVMCAIIP